VENECQKCREEILVKVTRVETILEGIEKSMPNSQTVQVHTEKLKLHSWLIGIIFTSFIGLVVASTINN